jgi:hypothetical protein
MERLIEQLADEGDVLDGRTRLGRVRYHLSIYQHFTEGEDQATVGTVEVEGLIVPIDDLGLADRRRRRAELTLRLADGRMLDFLMVNQEGTIRSTGRGLHRP